MDPTGKHVQYMIGGVPVLFPCKPYPSQIAMMAKIMRALEREENALLESPTGSGKSLALLCSCLAWQKQMKDKLMVEKQKSLAEYQSLAASQQEDSKPCQCHCHGGGVSTTCNTPSVGQTGSRTPVITSPNNPGVNSLIHHSIEASTGQVEIKGIASDQGVIATNQNDVKSSDQRNINSLDLDHNVFASDQGGVKYHTDGQKEVKAQICCESNGNCDDGDHQNANNSTTMVKSENNGQVVDHLKVDQDKDDDFKPPKKKYRRVGRKKRGVIYDDENEDEEDVKIEGDKSGNSGMIDLSTTTVQQQEEDSSNHPVWKMKLLGHSPIIKQVDVSDSSVSMVTTPNDGCHGVEMKQEGECSLCQCGIMKAKYVQLAQAVAKKIPVIFFGTRTHKQIKQITHELKKTAYAKTPMCILASREHTCVHPLVSLSKNKNEECQKLMDGLQGDQCSYYHNVGRFATQANIVSCGLDTAWDIEDLVMLGKKKRVCPYFVTRGLKDEAHIVFCPYNYLLDPMVTNQMDLHVEGNVIILDEGHNVEDTARDSSSLAVNLIELEEVVDEMDKMLSSHTTDHDIFTSYNTVKLVCNKYINWMKEHEHYLPQQMYEQGCKVWHGTDMVEEMRTAMKITPHLFEAYKAHLSSIVAAAREPLFAKSRRDRERYRAGLVPTVNMATLAIVENLFIVLSFLFNPRFTGDYRVALMKTTAMKYEKEVDGWHRRRRGNLQKVWTVSLNFWCLNPAVAFSGFNSTRCVILTSGTLSPMLSFASELGTNFPIQLEANHVISNSQVWIGTLCSGPHGRQLCASYQNTESYDFQDEIGRLVLDVCKIVPYGILCFFTSYKMLEKLTNRWKTVGIWEEINQQKAVVCEPRAGDKADFERSMMIFYEAVNRAHHNNAIDNAGADYGVNGALFLAVCRGKVSEGLDFIDNNARAVITVGIPYPYVKDKQVELKKEYNNEHCIKKSLLNGGEWYEIQAYRALNQALGRCIRHKNDWGALILVDERFSKSERYIRGLSKWVRQGIRHYTDYPSAQMSLKKFAEERLATSAVSNTASPPNFISTCNVSTVTLDASSHQTPSSTSVRQPTVTPSTPVCQPAMTPSSPLHQPVVTPSTPIRQPAVTRFTPVSQPTGHQPTVTPSTPIRQPAVTLSTPVRQPTVYLPTMTPSTPVRQTVTGISYATSPPKHAVTSPLTMPLSPLTQQVILHNPHLAGLLAEQLRLAGLQQLNTSNTCTQLPAQAALVTLNNHTPSVSVAQETPAMHIEAKSELNDTVIIPDSPPVDDDNTTEIEISSSCESPPLFNSPVKQPITSTQVDTNCEIKELDKSSGTQGAETLEMTGVVNLEQHNTVVSLSSREIVLPANLTACDQTDSMAISLANESIPEQQRQSLRKRSETHNMANFKHTKKRQHRKQPEVDARNHSMCCVVCHKELAKLTVKNEKEFASVGLVSRLQKLVNNGSKSLLISWLSRGDQQAFMIPTNQLAKTSHLASQMQGGFNSIWDDATGLAYCPMACTCDGRVVVLVEIVATNKRTTLSTYCNKTIVLSAMVNIVKERTCTVED